MASNRGDRDIRINLQIMVFVTPRNELTRKLTIIPIAAGTRKGSYSIVNGIPIGGV